MKRILMNGVVFTGLATVLYLGVFWLLCTVQVGETPFIYRVSKVFNWKGGGAYLKFREFNPEKEYDIIILGSSHAYRGYDPAIFKEFGYSAFNLGSSAQSPMNSYYIVQQYLTQKNTRLLLLDVYESGFESDGLESTADLIQNISNNKAALGMAWAIKDPRAINMLTLRMMRANTGAMFTDAKYEGLGFTSNSDSVGTDIVHLKDKDFEPNKLQKKYFRKILELCQERGIKVVLVDHPYPLEMGQKKHIQFNAYLGELVDEFAVPYLDHAFKHELDSRDHFYDHNHMNTAGVRIYNPQLITELEEIGLLKRH